MSLTLQPIRVATGFDEEQRLVAVMVHLSDENEVAPVQWYLEAGFGWIGGTNHPHFSNLDMAQDWISQRVADTARSGVKLQSN
jgi:hypothetical protein